MLINTAIRQRIYPTKSQESLFWLFFGHCRFVWNFFLELITQEYQEHKKSFSYLECSLKLTKMKRQKEYLWLGQISAISLQQSLRMLQTAFQRFFKKQANYPKFKKKYKKESFHLMKNGFRLENGKLYIARCKTPIKVRWSKKLPSDPSSITISRDSANRFFVTFIVEEKFVKLPETDQKIGIDVGLINWIVDSKSGKISRINYTKEYSKILAYWQRKLKLNQKKHKKGAVLKKGSQKFKKIKLKIAKICMKIADLRKNRIHQETARIINENQVIVLESLKVKNMLRNHKLAKSIADASWGEVVRQLVYKALRKGRKTIFIDQWFPSSKMCSKCHHIHHELELNDRTWVCPHCQAELDRDINAAINILAYGLWVLASGETGSGVEEYLLYLEKAQ